nr:DUF899 domain-containing protein [Gammaproteobacteria bacterium]
RRLLDREKALTRLRDEIAEERRALPRVAVEKDYSFEGENGSLSMLELFGNCSQLMIYHFMYSPDWDGGCTSCSFWADNFDGIDTHLAHRDISFLAVSNAPFPTLQTYAQRFDWKFRWYSTNGSGFSEDFGVTFGESERKQNRIHYNYRDQDFYTEELPGVSVFVRDADDGIFHTYSTYARGLDILNGAYHYIDLAPRGRHEDDGMSWLRRKDEY